MALSQKSVHVLLYEGEGAQPLTADERFATVAALLERGFPVSRSNEEAQRESANGAPRLVVANFTNGKRPALAEGQGTMRCESITGFNPSQVVELAEAAREQ